jgi:hypothetical protein
LDRAPQRGAAFAITRASGRARTRSIGSRSRARGSSLIFDHPPPPRLKMLEAAYDFSLISSARFPRISHPLSGLDILSPSEFMPKLRRSIGTVLKASDSNRDVVIWSLIVGRRLCLPRIRIPHRCRRGGCRGLVVAFGPARLVATANPIGNWHLLHP